VAATLITATDDAYGIVHTAWNANVGAIAGSGGHPLVNWLIDGDGIPDAPGKCWARVKVLNQDGNAQSIGGKRYVNSGNVFVNIFVPIEGYDYGTVAQQLAQAIASAFKASADGPSEVEYMQVRAVDVGYDGPWFQVDVRARFQYDDFS
jgi:hypothetical protein